MCRVLFEQSNYGLSIAFVERWHRHDFSGTMAMSTVKSKPLFVERFEAAWQHTRRTQVAGTITWGLVLAFFGLIVLTTTDYLFEVSWGDRAFWLGLISIASLTLAVTWMVIVVNRWSKLRAAKEIETRYPELGQSVRTSLEFGRQSAESLAAAGIQPSLVQALAEETDRKAESLDLSSGAPSNRVWMAVAITSTLAIVIVVATLFSWEWRVATLRALLSDQPYTELSIAPGDQTVTEGESINVAIDVAGRTNRNVIIASRIAGSNDGWNERELTDEDVAASQTRLVKYHSQFKGIVAPIEYRVKAGPVQSPLYRIAVRHPLRIENISAEVTPPQYTGLAASTIDEGNLSVIHGSTVRLNITLDRQPESATVVMTERRRLGPGESPTVETIPLEINDCVATTLLNIDSDQTYTIVAKAADGMELRENKYRIRVRYDQPPEVWFETPAEALEVTSVAEVLLRARVRDDFGLTRAGIVFEVNNEEEYTLAARDYLAMSAALAESESTATETSGQAAFEQATSNPAASDGSHRWTRDAMERLLPLELFNLEEKDSVTYYAFAEDNLPTGVQRTETDLRFIDIRPFRRVYRLPGEGGGNANGPQIRFLSELISRQRFNLNRTIRMDRKTQSGEEPTLGEVDRIAEFEDDLSKSCFELAVFLDEREFDGSDLLFQAEMVMLTAVDSLNVGKFDLSARQQKDALRLLIEGRNTLETLLRKGLPNSQRQALGNFDRMQTQKLRRTKRSQANEDTPEQLVARIRRLASQQQLVAQSLIGIASATNLPAVNGANAGTRGAAMPSADGVYDRDTEQELAETEQSQLDIAIETREVEAAIEQVRESTTLVQSRASHAADSTDEVSGAIARGDTDLAAETARQASEQLRELAANLEGVSATETVQQISMSRDIAAMLAAMQRRVVSSNPDDKTDDDADADETTKPTAIESREARTVAARRARLLSETGRTLEDILGSAIASNRMDDGEAVRQLSELLTESELEKVVERMSQIAPMIEQDRAKDAQVEGDDIADRLEVLSRKLDGIYRSVVTPRVARLMELEKRATQQQNELKSLLTNQQISNWHRKTLELMEEIDKTNVASASLDELYAAFQKQGWGKMNDELQWDWERDEQDGFEAPSEYVTGMQSVVDDIQQQLQELMLSDMVSDANEATPPKYKHLVDRYIEVLGGVTP